MLLSEIIDSEVEQDKNYQGMNKAEKLLAKTTIKRMLSSHDGEVAAEDEDNVRTQLRFALAAGVSG